jgi:hypothetical protein
MTTYLRSSLERARQRLVYCQREYDRCERNYDAGDPRAARTLGKLAQEIERAERDLAYAEHAIA